MRHVVCDNLCRRNEESSSLLAIHHSPEISVYVSDTGSEVVEVCTTVTNTKCRCRAGFVPRDTSDSSTCKCERGFGLNGTGTE